MTEGTAPQRSDERDAQGSRDVAHAGGGRTEGETSVDDALGSQENPD